MNTSVSVCPPKKNSVPLSFRTFSASVFALLSLGLPAVLGCSSGTSSAKPQVGAITFTDANGTPQKSSPSSLTVGQGTYVGITLANDSQLLGADWSVVCGSAPPPGTPLPPGQTQDVSCGTFTPAHTMSGPIPSYITKGTGFVALYTAPPAPPKQGVVTLYASATADHSRFSTVTLTIGGQPISVGFAPSPPSTLGAGASVQFKAALNNDVNNAGVTWSAVCGSSDCGFFGPTQTITGVATTYVAPAIVPAGGTVQVTATSIADPTKAVSATIQIVPIGVSVTPTTLTVPTAGTASLTATVVNDGIGRGVDWGVSCTNTVSPGNCGTITAHTVSGAPATYTAPSITNIAVDIQILITASSTSDPTKSATAIATTVKGDLVSGKGQAGQLPVSGAQVTLYAAATAETALHSAANTNNATAIVTAFTDQEGNFSIPYGYECPTPDTQMYLVSTGGNAGRGTNPNLALMAALGSCSDLDASRFVIDEATTIAAIYALNGFMADPQHIGSPATPLAGMATAFTTAKDLVDVTTGLVRTQSISGKGTVPLAKINTLSNLLSSCAKTAGSAQDDGSPCDQLFRATNPGATSASRPANTVQALFNLARNATSFPGNPNAFGALYQLATSSLSFGPTLSVEPGDWTLAIQFPNGQKTSNFVSAKVLSTDNSDASVDSAGNVWVRSGAESVTEFVGAASCVGAPKTLVPLSANSGITP